MAKSQEQRWAEGYYGALVGLTVRKVEIVCDESAEHYGMPVEWWPTITLVADDGEEFVVEVSRDPEGNGAGFLFGLPTFSAPEVACERCSEGIDFYDPSNFENLSALEVGPEEVVCASCVTRVERGWIDTIVHAGESKKSDIWPEYAGECDICDLPVLYGQDEHNRDTGNHFDCEVKRDADRNAWWAPFDKMCDEVEGRIGQRPFVEHTGGGIFTVCLPVTPDDKSGDYGKPLICTGMYSGPDDETGEGVYEVAGATLSVFPSSDGTYITDLYMDVDYNSPLYERWSDFEETFRHMVEDRYDDSIGHDAMVEHHIKVLETWKRERHNVPEGVVTGLEVTA